MHTLEHLHVTFKLRPLFVHVCISTDGWNESSRMSTFVHSAGKKTPSVKIVITSNSSRSQYCDRATAYTQNTLDKGVLIVHNLWYVHVSWCVDPNQLAVQTRRRRANQTVLIRFQKSVDRPLNYAVWCGQYRAREHGAETISVCTHSTFCVLGIAYS